MKYISHNSQHVNENLFGRCHLKSGKGKETAAHFGLWAHTIVTSDPGDNCQFVFQRYIEVTSYSCHSSYSSSLLYIYAYVLCDSALHVHRKDFSLLSKYLLGGLLSQVFDRQLCEIPCFFFLKGPGTAGTFFSSSPSLIPAGKEVFWLFLYINVMI